MSDTQITYPVWNRHYELSWLPTRTIRGLPGFINDFLRNYLGSPFLLFRIRDDIISILRTLPETIAAHPLIEIDVCLSASAAGYLETVTGKDVYQIGCWLTNQFSSLHFHEKIGRKIPNTVIHVWRDDLGENANDGYKIYMPWADRYTVYQKSNLALLISRVDVQRESPAFIINHNRDKVTGFGMEDLCKLLRWSPIKAMRRYPLLSDHHIEIASTVSKDGLERLWVRHCAYHESWKISENTAVWEAIPRDAWVPVLRGNVLVLGRVIPVANPVDDHNAIQMVVLPGSLLLKVYET